MSKRWEMIWLAVATFVCMGAAMVGMVVAIMSPIAFDSPGAKWNPIAWLAFLMMITLWVVCILAPFAAWVMFRRQRSEKAWMLMSLPPLWAGVMALLLIILSG